MAKVNPDLNQPKFPDLDPPRFGDQTHEYLSDVGIDITTRLPVSAAPRSPIGDHLVNHLINNTPTPEQPEVEQAVDSSIHAMVTYTVAVAQILSYNLEELQQASNDISEYVANAARNCPKMEDTPTTKGVDILYQHALGMIIELRNVMQQIIEQRLAGKIGKDTGLLTK